MTIRRMLRVASIMLGSFGVRDGVAASLGELGERIEQARTTEFFRWFHLEEAGRTNGQAGTVIQFKPSGEKFRPLVTVSLSLDSRERLVGAELVLSRAFVDSGRDGVFARDIAKSFLSVVTTADERKAIAGLIGEIDPATRKITVAPSPGYWTFLGEQKFYEHSLANGRIRLENRDVNGVPSLVIARR